MIHAAAKLHERGGEHLDDDMPRQAIIGVAELVDVVDPGQLGVRERFVEGPRCWVLRNPRALAQPLPAPGAMGLWWPSAAQIQAVRRGLSHQESGQ